MSYYETYAYAKLVCPACRGEGFLTKDKFDRRLKEGIQVEAPGHIRFGDLLGIGAYGSNFD